MSDILADGSKDKSESSAFSASAPPSAMLSGSENRPLLRRLDFGYESLENIQPAPAQPEQPPDLPTADTHIDVEKGLLEIPGSVPDTVPADADFDIPRDRLKTLFSFGFMLVCMLFTTTALAFVHDRLPQTPPLRDVVFDLVPQWDLGLSISEYLLIASVWTSIILVIFNRYRWVVFRRLFMIIGLLYLGRSFTMAVTALPLANTNYYCSPQVKHTTLLIILERVGMLFSGLGLSVNGRHTYCGDYIYSGHTCMLVISAMVVQEYAPRKFLPLMVVIYLMALTGIVMVSISRGHYTVDIVVAYYITTRVFWMYHTMVCNSIIKDFGPRNYLSNVWWFRLMRYFESNVPVTNLPKHFSWPLPFPARWQDHRWDYDQ